MMRSRFNQDPGIHLQADLGDSVILTVRGNAFLFEGIVQANGNGFVDARFNWWGQPEGARAEQVQENGGASVNTSSPLPQNPFPSFE